MLKHVIGVCMIAATAVFAGCKLIPTDAQVSGFAYAAGKAAAYACEMRNVDEDSITKINEVIRALQTIAPSTNETFTAAWSTHIECELTAKVNSGAMTQTQAKIIESVVKLAVKGVDHLFDRHPDWRTYPNLTSIAVNAFADAFVGHSMQAHADSLTADAEFDLDTYQYLMELKARE